LPSILLAGDLFVFEIADRRGGIAFAIEDQQPVREGHSMKAICISICVAGFLLSVSAFGQGRVEFANTSTTPLTTNTDCSLQNLGLITGVKAYRIGLYVAPFGATQDFQFTLMGLATNGLPGLFAGAFPFTLSGFPADIPVSFQVRAWQLPAGSSYEEAIFQGWPQYPYLGVSARGFVMPSGSPAPVPRLFGTGYGQIPGFTLIAGICIPALAATNVTLNIIQASNGTHTVSWTNSATSYLLEWTAAVPDANQWQPVLTGVNNSNGLLRYTSTNTSARFYRLRRL
jgi:hypothetical protein